jgi:hypothetical protein
LRSDPELEQKDNKQGCRQDIKALGAFTHLLDDEQVSTPTAEKYGEAGSFVPNNRYFPFFMYRGIESAPLRPNHESGMVGELRKMIYG